MSTVVRVLLADDHRIVREGLKMVLADDPDLQVVAEADNGPAVLAQVQALQGRLGVDVVLLDIALPDMDGLDVLQALRRDWPDLPVLMLSTYPEKQYAVRCLQLGAAGYLNKSTDTDALMAALPESQSGLLRGLGAAGSGVRTWHQSPHRRHIQKSRCACFVGHQASLW